MGGGGISLSTPALLLWWHSRNHCKALTGQQNVSSLNAALLGSMESSVIGLFNQQWKTIKYRQRNKYSLSSTATLSKLADRAESQGL